MKSIYLTGDYLNSNPTWHEEDSLWKAKNISKLLKDNKIHPSTVVEVGCGAGEILNSLSNMFGETVNFYGYEISPQAYSISKLKEKKNLFFSNLMDDLPASFDLAMAIDVFEHIDDYLGFLRKLKSRAQNQVFHIPLDLSVQTVLRRSPIMHARKVAGHIHYFTKETALASLMDAGYEIVDWRYTNSSLELSNLGWLTTLMKLPRKMLFWLNKDFCVRVLGGFSLLVLAK